MSLTEPASFTVHYSALHDRVGALQNAAVKSTLSHWGDWKHSLIYRRKNVITGDVQHEQAFQSSSFYGTRAIQINVCTEIKTWTNKYNIGSEILVLKRITLALKQVLALKKIGITE